MNKDIPAFPHLNPNFDNNWDKEPQRGGMTLRDYFAGQALIGLMSSALWVKGMDESAHKQGAKFKNFLSKECYAMADEMLKARGA